MEKIKMDRNQKVSAIRPQLNLDTEHSKDTEKFQNNVLRGILKFQNDLLVAIFKNYIIKRKFDFHNKSKEDRQAFVVQGITKDLRFNQHLLGIIIGMFTLDELEYFTSNEKALKKRINALLVQRILNNFKLD